MWAGTDGRRLSKRVLRTASVDEVSEQKPRAPRIPSKEKLLEPHHRDVSGGSLRAAVFGMSDGLVSNAALVLGVAGANPTPGTVRLAGLAGLVAGACSMAAGEYISMRAQREVLEHELNKERIELSHRPEIERAELQAIYEERGISSLLAEQLATEMMRDPEIAFETHAREELGVNPNSLGSPAGAALSSFATFTLGAAVPLVPWLVGSGTAAVVASMVASAIAAALLGAMIGSLGGRSKLRSAMRQLSISTAAALITFLVGRVVGSTGIY